ncbi:MAG: hypothetical protein ACE5Q3_05025 [Alphaproteobacteria bacterium]
MGSGVPDEREAARASRRSKGSVWVGLGVCFAMVTLALIAIFDSAEWYAGRVSMARYCDDPRAATDLVHRILTTAEPAADTATRPYIVAAKLLYLAPREDAETIDAYTARLRRAIERSCR